METINPHDIKIKQTLDKAKLLGLDCSTIKTSVTKACHIIHKDNKDHILLIPSNIKSISEDNEELLDTLTSLKGNLKVIGGSGLKIAQRLFYECTLDKLDLSDFDTSNIEEMSSMFRHSSIKQLNLGNFNTTKAKSLKHMFSYLLTDNLDLSTFHIRSDANIDSIFYECHARNVRILDRYLKIAYNGYKLYTLEKILDYTAKKLGEIKEVYGTFEHKYEIANYYNQFVNTLTAQLHYGDQSIYKLSIEESVEGINLFLVKRLHKPRRLYLGDAKSILLHTETDTTIYHSIRDKIDKFLVEAEK